MPSNAPDPVVSRAPGEPQVPGASAGRRPDRERLLAATQEYSVVVAVIALLIALTFASSAFLTKTNLLNILDQNAPTGIAACGATLVIVGGGFDLSAGAAFALAGVLSAWLAVHVSAEVGLAGGVFAGVFMGLFNGLLVTRLRVNSFLATLSSSLIFSGLAVAVTGGFLITVSSKSFTDIGQNDILGLKYSIVIFAVVAVLCHVLLSRSVFGKYVYAVGGNAEAARLSGVRVDAVRTGTFVVSSLCASAAGVLAATKVGTGQADARAGLALDVIAAVVLGGASILGGIGTVWRTVLGVLLLALITNGFNILNIEPYFQDIATGLIIVGAVALNTLGRTER